MVVNPINREPPVIEVPDQYQNSRQGYVSEETFGTAQREDRDWYWLVWRKRRLIGRITAVGTVLALVIALLIPNRYQSVVKLMPPEQSTGAGLAMLAAMAGQGGSGSLTAGLGSMASDLLGVRSTGALFTDILYSRSVEDRLIDRFDLRKVYSDKYYQDTRKDLAGFTAVSEDRRSGVITLAVADRDRRRAQQMAQAYVEELNRMVALVSTSAARRERIFLEGRLQQVKRDLDTASSQFAEYASRNTVIDVTSQTKAMVESAATLQGQLIAAESELEGLQQIYTANNVRVRSLKARVDELRSQLQKMGGSDASAASTSTDASQPRSDQLYPSIRKLPLLGVRWADLYREVKIQETIFELLTQEYEVAKIQEAKETPTVKVLDPASWPERKSSPHRTVIVLLGMLVALSSGVVWVLGTATWQQMDPQDSRKQLGQEMAGRFTAFWSRRIGSSRAITKAAEWWARRRASSGSSSQDLK
jgi:capsule polysaccharide export protein KpsE/RkpR